MMSVEAEANMLLLTLQGRSHPCEASLHLRELAPSRKSGSSRSYHGWRRDWWPPAC